LKMLHANSMFRIATEFTEINEKKREIINAAVEEILKKRNTKKCLFRKTIENEKSLDEKIGNSKSKSWRTQWHNGDKSKDCFR